MSETSPDDAVTDDAEFDRRMIAAALELAAEGGWGAVSPLAAARRAGLPVDRVRARFPRRGSILLALGRMADTAALTGAMEEGPVRDRLFDVLMRRIDALQAHRAGVLAVLKSLPADPGTALLLACATERSMGWMLEAAGVSATGLRGLLKVKGLTGVWLWTIRAWERDDSEDLSATMAALDTALGRAESFAQYLNGAPRPAGATAAGEVADPSEEESG